MRGQPSAEFMHSGERRKKQEKKNITTQLLLGTKIKTPKMYNPRCEKPLLICDSKRQKGIRRLMHLRAIKIHWLIHWFVFSFASWVMNLKILLSFFAAGIVSTVMEPIRIKRPVVDYDYVATCLAKGYMALKEELSKMPNHKAETEDEKVKCSCNFLRVSFTVFLKHDGVFLTISLVHFMLDMY